MKVKVMYEMENKEINECVRSKGDVNCSRVLRSYSECFWEEHHMRGQGGGRREEGAEGNL